MKDSPQRSPAFSLHYPKALGISLLLLAIFSWIMVRQMTHLTHEDRVQYDRLMSEADPKSAGNEKTTPYSVAQNRTNIRKDYYFSRDSQRLHLRLASENATLMMDQSSEGSALMEKMQNVVCLMQEELYYLLPNGKEALKQPNGQLILKHSKPGIILTSEETLDAIPYQRIRHFEAEEASYQYHNGQFRGKNVKIMHYAIPDHILPNTTSAPATAMIGAADSAELSMSHGEPRFKAFGFKAQLSASGRQK